VRNFAVTSTRAGGPGSVLSVMGAAYPFSTARGRGPDNLAHGVGEVEARSDAGEGDRAGTLYLLHRAGLHCADPITLTRRFAPTPPAARER
jgi:hypothetical protein